MMPTGSPQHMTLALGDRLAIVIQGLSAENSILGVTKKPLSNVDSSECSISHSSESSRDPMISTLFMYPGSINILRATCMVHFSFPNSLFFMVFSFVGVVKFTFHEQHYQICALPHVVEIAQLLYWRGSHSMWCSSKLDCCSFLKVSRHC